MTLLTPTGHKAEAIDRIMLLSMWAKCIQNEQQGPCLDKISPVLMAGMGRPSYPLNKAVAQAAIHYWTRILSDDAEVEFPLSESNKMKNIYGTVIDYGDPRGDIEARQKIAIAFSSWYQTQIAPRNILFTVGGASAIQIIFQTVSEKYNDGIIITPFPCYSLYKKSYNEDFLYPIDVMKSEGYQLTSSLLEETLQQSNEYALQKKKKVAALLLCDPNNPLGTIIENNELYSIAEVLRKHPDILVILDEAYAEMRLDGKQHISLLRIAPDLSSRMVLMRSATKALSAAGERMAALIAFDDTLMDHFLQKSVNLYGHAPRSSQHIYAAAMEKLDHAELTSMNNYYNEHIRYVEKRLTDMGIAMPDKRYRVEGTFYIVANFSELIGGTMPKNARRALPEKEIVETDEDIAYYLLFKYSVMISPLSYFGLSDTLGYMRITCSGGNANIKNLLDRLEMAVMDARIISKLNTDAIEIC